MSDQYSQTPTFYIENMSGAAFRALLNQILAALSEQNSGSTEPSEPFPGMFWLDTSVKPAQLRLRNDNNDGWDNVFTHGHPPTQGQIGLPNVDNYTSTASLTDGSPNKFFLASGAKQLQDNKLEKTASAANSLKLGNYPAADFAFKVGTYPQLRAQATTQADVGLSLVKNFNISDSLTANNSNQYASSKAVYQLNQNKVATTVTINGKALSSNITLTAADVQALPAKGGNLTGPISYTPNSGDVIRFGTKAVLRKISSNDGVSLGCADALILGAGNARDTLEKNVSVTAKQVHAGADDTFYIYSNLQNGWSSRRRFDFEVDGGFKPANVSKTRANLSVYAKSETYPRNQLYTQVEIDKELSDATKRLDALELRNHLIDIPEPFVKFPVGTTLLAWTALEPIGQKIGKTERLYRTDNSWGADFFGSESYGNHRGRYLDGQWMYLSYAGVDYGGVYIAQFIRVS